jgi:hypothetical protein
MREGRPARPVRRAGRGRRRGTASGLGRGGVGWSGPTSGTARGRQATAHRSRAQPGGRPLQELARRGHRLSRDCARFAPEPNKGTGHACAVAGNRPASAWPNPNRILADQGADVTVTAVRRRTAGAPRQVTHLTARRTKLGRIRTAFPCSGAGCHCCGRAGSRPAEGVNGRTRIPFGGQVRRRLGRFRGCCWVCRVVSGGVVMWVDRGSGGVGRVGGVVRSGSW